MKRKGDKLSAINTIIFDAMGVIFEAGDDIRDCLIPYLRKLDPSISDEKVLELYRPTSLGQLSSYRFWSELGFGNEYPEIEKNYLDSCLSLDAELVPILESLSGKYRLTILSNDVGDWARYLRAKHDLDRFFDRPIVSGDVGLRKPDPAIYKNLLAVHRVDPRECVFIDDRYPNLAAAAALGMKTIRFARESFDKTFNPDFEISSFRELPKALEEI